jgi:hypothetical protein
MSHSCLHAVVVARMNRRTWRRIRAIVIWAAIPILIWTWTRPTDATLRAAISATYAVFFLLAAPVWCAAENRDGRTYCRNNSTGLLVGCHLRQHRWQKITALTASAAPENSAADSSTTHKPAPPSSEQPQPSSPAPQPGHKSS